jgi:hypothetical protein
MSFSVEFHARSREHAKRLLDLHSSQLPTSVLSFVKASVDGLPPLRDGFSRIVHVKANGHLCNSDGSYAVSTATVAVTPIEIPD